ncbi:Hypothetical predicted protein [Paramuricea clavata]|uniref:Uncharacterized protein n=1 Tax=Paramuricea clavata TaxID=317549 RepID=A0A6S7G8B0_PARCT|nr:Hypothetical predicted protein [Paramuricea clavata]
MKEEHDKQFLSECVEDTSKTGKKVKGRKRKGDSKTGSEENIPTLTEDVKSIKKRKRGKPNGNKLCDETQGGDTVDKHSKKKKNKSVVQDSSEIAPVGNENDVKDKLSKEAEASGNKGSDVMNITRDSSDGSYLNTNNTKRKIKDTPRIVSSADSLCQSDLGLAAETIIETPEEATEIAKGDDINLTPDSMPLAVFLRHAQKKVTQERKKNDNYTNRETTIMEHMKPMGPLKMDGNVAENWRKWRQRWNLYAKASGAERKDEEIQCAIFLHTIGEEALEIYDTFTFTETEQDKIEPLIQKFESYCTPRKNTTYERYIFNTCVQNGRKLDAFILDLRNKAKTCEFESLQDSLIKDRIVCGIDSNSIRERLLRDNDLTLEKAISIVRAAETSKTQVQKLNNPSLEVESIHKNFERTSHRKYQREETKPSRNVGKTQSCSRCGSNHAPKQCPAFGQTCHKCHGNNHFAKMCRSKNLNTQMSETRVHEVRKEKTTDNSSTEEDELFIAEIATTTAKIVLITNLKVNGKNVNFKIDTGAQCNVLPEEIFDGIKQKPQLIATGTKLTAYGGAQVPVKGKCVLEIEKTADRKTEFNRMPFGICSASDVAQKMVDDEFSDIPGALAVHDDIIVSGANTEEHDIALEKVLHRARERNIKFNKKKIQLRVTEVKYLGNIVSAKGFTPDPEKIKAIVEMPLPKSKQDLQRLLGMVNYLSQYIPNMSEITAPLRTLLKKDIQWSWHNEHQKALERIKKVLTSSPVLHFYDIDKPVILQVDASQGGLGACLIQEGHPVIYASRSLTNAEQHYAQIEKELLAIVFACERFNQFIYGTQVTVHSDHKPLEAIIAKPLSQAPPRIQRLLIRLQKYHPTVKYVPGKFLFIADTLSTAYLPEEGEQQELNEDIEVMVHSMVTAIPASPEKMAELKEETANDETLQQLKQQMVQGWPDRKHEIPQNLATYWNIRHELSEAEGLIFKDHQLVIPTAMRSNMLNLIHKSHLGIEKCKARARAILFWPGMSKDIYKKVSKCATCATYRRRNQKEPMIAHQIPERPWKKLGTDLCECKGKNYLVVIDYHWPSGSYRPH